MGDVDTMRTTEVGINEPFSSEQVVLQKEFHSFIAFCEYSIYFIILGQDAGPDPSRGSGDGKSKFSVIHVKELIKFFSQKLNRLRSLYFLPIKARADFYFKVLLPSVTYGLVVRGSCGKSLFDELEKIHVRAAKIIYGLD